ncbi:MAG: hypothetical protein H0U59_04225, partial [Gemmatimonadaceae bacterium]|nr:hypothetical protein [Gemmatimonadaceae bacterium]
MNSFNDDMATAGLGMVGGGVRHPIVSNTAMQVKKPSDENGAYSALKKKIQQTQKKTAAPRDLAKDSGPEVKKLASMLGKGLGMAGKALGFLPTGVGNVAGAALG